MSGDSPLGEQVTRPLIPRPVLGATALLSAGILVALAALGPLWLGSIQYRSSQSAVWQIMGQDLVDLALIAPLLVVGGVLHLMGRPASKYFLVLSPITLMYVGLSEGVGQEWSHPVYTGNVESYWPLYLGAIIGGLIILVGSLSLFSTEDAPRFNPRSLRVYVALFSLFLLLFGAMWVSQMVQVASTGDLVDGSYSSAPTAFWAVKYLDLGVTIPLGFIALYLLAARTREAYPLILLFFGFFITLGTAVNAMALIQVLMGDPQIVSASGGLVIFPVLGVLTYLGFFYLVKDKIPRFRSSS